MADDNHLDNIGDGMPSSELSNWQDEIIKQREEDFNECRKQMANRVPTTDEMLKYKEEQFADNVRIANTVLNLPQSPQPPQPKFSVQRPTPPTIPQPKLPPQPPQLKTPTNALAEIKLLDNDLVANVKKQERAREEIEQHAIKLQLYYKIYCYPAKTGRHVSEGISVLDITLINRHYLVLQQSLYDLLIDTANVFLPELNTYIVDERRATERTKITSLVNDINENIQIINTTSMKQMQLTSQLVHAQTAYLSQLSQTSIDTTNSDTFKEHLMTPYQMDDYLRNYMLETINKVNDEY